MKPIHWAPTNAKERLAFARSWCGIALGKAKSTVRSNEVTCKRCLAAFRKA